MNKSWLMEISANIESTLDVENDIIILNLLFLKLHALQFYDIFGALRQF